MAASASPVRMSPAVATERSRSAPPSSLAHSQILIPFVQWIWRRARISTCRAVRLRNDARRVPNSAEIVGTHGNRKENDNPQFISHFEVYENYSEIRL